MYATTVMSTYSGFSWYLHHCNTLQHKPLPCFVVTMDIVVTIINIVIIIIMIIIISIVTIIYIHYLW